MNHADVERDAEPRNYQNVKNQLPEQFTSHSIQIKTLWNDALEP